MKVLLDHCVPRPLRRHLPGHSVKTAYQMGWALVKNGDLIRAAEAEFDVMISSDQSLRYQQNLEEATTSADHLADESSTNRAGASTEDSRGAGSDSAGRLSGALNSMADNQKRDPYHLFATVEEEIAATREFWLNQTGEERIHYLEHLRYLEYGEEAMSAPFVRCYGWRKLGEEPDPKNVVYF